MSSAAGALIILTVIVVLVGVPLAAIAWTSRAKPGRTNMVLIGAAAGPAEVDLWRARLRHAGLSCHIVNVGDISGQGPSQLYSYEVWVRERDEEAARRVLGL